MLAFRLAVQWFYDVTRPDWTVVRRDDGWWVAQDVYEADQVPFLGPFPALHEAAAAGRRYYRVR